MAMTSVRLKIEEETAVQALHETGEKLDSVEGEVTLDFSSVRRLDPSAVRGLEKLAGLADARGVKVVLCGVNIGVYKVLKLAKLTSRFTFVG